MDGVIANLPAICDLAEQYHALVVVDDSHAVGFMGRMAEGLMNIIRWSTGSISLPGHWVKPWRRVRWLYIWQKPVIEWLRQRSGPYLFSNSVAPGIVSASIQVVDLLKESDALRRRLWQNAAHFRQRMTAAGFTLGGADHAIIPIMLGDAKVAAEFAERALEKGMYVVGFSYPVVPKGQARIRTQMSAAHTRAVLDRAIDVFIAVGQAMGILVGSAERV
ncbi:aminotransferase class I/II-fold pyridoxal phosphate-dependent enzyme [Vibrio sp. PP-XX7]